MRIPIQSFSFYGKRALWQSTEHPCDGWCFMTLESDVKMYCFSESSRILQTSLKINLVFLWWQFVYSVRLTENNITVRHQGKTATWYDCLIQSGSWILELSDFELSNSVTIIFIIQYSTIWNAVWVTSATAALSLSNRWKVKKSRW